MEQEQTRESAKILQAFLASVDNEIQIEERTRNIRVEMPNSFYHEVKRHFYARGELPNFLLLCCAAIAQDKRDLTVGELEGLVLARSRG